MEGIRWLGYDAWAAAGDSPGLNAAIRGVGKVAIGDHGMKVVGFRDGFRGLAEDRRIPITSTTLAGILPGHSWLAAARQNGTCVGD